MRLDFGGIRPRGVGFARPLGNVHNFTPNQLRQSVDRLRIACAEIENFATDARLSGHEESARDVRNVYEVAPLRSISDYCQWFTLELLRQKNPENRTVYAGRSHPRSVRVEDANRDNRQPV